MGRLLAKNSDFSHFNFFKVQKIVGFWVGFFFFPGETYPNHTGQGRKTHCITTAELEMSIFLLLLDQSGPVLHTWPNSALGGPVPSSVNAPGLKGTVDKDASVKHCIRAPSCTR